MNLKIIKRAFTLVEMLIVIVIIWILSSALIPRVVGIQDRAKKTSALHELRQIGQLIFLAQQNTESTLREITHSNCTYCTNNYTTYSGVIIYFGKDSASWKTSLEMISQAAGNTSSLTEFYTDPWGYPYFFDENEGEQSYNQCRGDILMSVGKDGATTHLWTLSSSTIYDVDADNIIMDLRPSFCSWWY